MLVWFSDWDSRDTFLESSAIFSQSCGKDAGGGGGFGEEGGFGHAGDGVGFQDVGAGGSAALAGGILEIHRRSISIESP